VALTVLANGTLTIHCNGVLQARWASADVPTDRPLYAIVGMRAPLKAVLLRQRVPTLTLTVTVTRTLPLTLTLTSPAPSPSPYPYPYPQP